MYQSRGAFSRHSGTHIGPLNNSRYGKCISGGIYANRARVSSLQPGLKLIHSANHLPLRAVAFAVQEIAVPVSAATSAHGASKSSTSYWPCRDGQLVKIVQQVDNDGKHNILQITVQGLADHQDADFLWGVYRSSPHAWQHPESISIPGSHVDESSGAMLSPMHPSTDSTTSQTITVNIPQSLAPITFAFLIALSPTPDTAHAQDTHKKKRKFAAPLEGRHFSILIGAAPGLPAPLGASVVLPAASSSKKKKSSSAATTATAPTDKATVNFAVRARGSSTISLVLMQPPSGGKQQWTAVEMCLDPTLNRTGDTWHIAVPNLRNLDKIVYGWRVDGDVSWESGYRIQPDQILLDPGATAVRYMPTEPPAPLPLPCVELADGQKVLAGSVIAGAAAGAAAVSVPLKTPLEKVKALEIDVRSFAQGSKVTHPGTFLGVTERLDHIRAVGANAVILTPCYATARGAGASHRAALSFFAPDPTLSTDPSNPAAAHAELREMVHALHGAGIEVILSLDVTFTADGVDAHPTAVSLRGLDYAAYYRPNGVLNCGHPAVQDLITRALRFWALQFGVDGFCFINAENMTQDAEGLVVDAPALPESLCQDPVLAGLKLIAAPSNEALLPRGGARGFPHWGLWQERNSAFSSDVIAFMADCSHLAMNGVAARLTGSANVFGPGWSDDAPGNLAIERRPSFSFNPSSSPTFGKSMFSIATDAAGAAGAAVIASGSGAPIPSATTIAKSILLAVIVAQGVPVISQNDVADVELARFVGIISRLRNKLAPLLLPPRFDSPRDLTWHNAFGTEPEWIDPAALSDTEESMAPPAQYHVPHGGSYLAFSVRHPDGAAVYVGFNPHPMLVNAMLPPPPPGHSWLRAVDTSLSPPDDAEMDEFVEVTGGEYGVQGKGAIMLIAAVVDHLR